MQEKTTPMCEATEQAFFAVCRDCGNLKGASFDHKRCECGGVYHVDCAFGNYPKSTETCKEWIRESNAFILGKRKDVGKALKDANLKCAECNRCHETCPEGIYRRHGNMYMKHLTGNPLWHGMNIHPYSNWRIKQPAIENGTRASTPWNPPRCFCTMGVTFTPSRASV